MKKLTAIFAVLILATTIKVSAQSAGKVSTTDISRVTKVGPGEVIFSGVNLKEGTNRVQSKELAGTIVFVKKGNSFSDVIFTDDAGATTRLTPTRGGTNGAPKPECKTKVPDACFSSPDKNIGLCICRPDELSTGGTSTIRIRISAGNNK